MTKDREKLYTALSLWINHIETGDVNTNKDFILRYSGVDETLRQKAEVIPKLTEKQERYLRELRELQHKIIMGGDI